MARFTDRLDAGRVLAGLLPVTAREGDPIVLGLPRGGVAVAYELARALAAPLDVYVVRRLVLPDHRDVTLGAVAHQTVVLDEDLARSVGAGTLEAIVKRERAEVSERERLYRGPRPYPALGGRDVILVDDGLTPAATLRAAVTALHRSEPASITVAIPVASIAACNDLETRVDEVVCACKIGPILPVAHWYEDFDPTTDAEVRLLLTRAADWSSQGAGPHTHPIPLA